MKPIDIILNSPDPEAALAAYVAQEVEAASERSPSLTLAELRAANASRVLLWHPKGVTDWSALEWAGAMTGEAGEAANVAKKLKRVDTAIKGRGSEQDREALVLKLGSECADTLIYLDLLAYREGIDLSEAVARTFNATSELHGFPQRLPMERERDNLDEWAANQMRIISGKPSICGHVEEGDSPVSIRLCCEAKGHEPPHRYASFTAPICRDCGDKLWQKRPEGDWLGKDGTPECFGNTPTTLHHPKD